MSESIERFVGWRVLARDGFAGTIADLILDLDALQVRYALVDLPPEDGREGPKTVPLPMAVLGDPLVSAELFPAEVRKSQVETSPPFHLPISRDEEGRVHRHHGCRPYWSDSDPGVPSPLFVAGRLRGLRVFGGRGSAGRLHELLVDGTSWTIVGARLEVLSASGNASRHATVRAGWVRDVVLGTRSSFSTCPVPAPTSQDRTARDDGAYDYHGHVMLSMSLPA